MHKFQVTFATSDQYSFRAGDTIGISTSHYGNIPFDYIQDGTTVCSSSSLYTAGDTAELTTAGGYNRLYSFQAVYTTC